jgi:GTPase SAR1 family protein
MWDVANQDDFAGIWRYYYSLEAYIIFSFWSKMFRNK